MANKSKMKVFKVVATSFEGDDGVEVTGVFVYLLPSDGEGDPQRKFFSDRMLAGMEYYPTVGDEVYLFYSGGRLVDLFKV